MECTERQALLNASLSESPPQDDEKAKAHEDAPSRSPTWLHSRSLSTYDAFASQLQMEAKVPRVLF